MARLTNTPQQQLQFDLERRKSYSFRCVLLNADRSPLNLTNCKLRFVMKAREYDEDLYDTTNVIVNHEARILSPEFGVATFAFQAAELDVAPGAYNYAIVLWTKDGYSVVVVKGIVNLHANTDSASMTKRYTTNSADAALELTLRGNDVVNIVTNTLTKSEARVEIIGTGRPDDAATLEATTIQQVANAQVGTLFISLDGAGIGAWAWRKRRTGWGLVEGFPIMWGDIQNRPSLFPPSSHQHPWSELTGVPTTFTPTAHTHPSTEITATGTRSDQTFLRGDNTWAVPAAGVTLPLHNGPSLAQLTGTPTLGISVSNNELSVSDSTHSAALTPMSLVLGTDGSQAGVNIITAASNARVNITQDGIYVNDFDASWGSIRWPAGAGTTELTIATTADIDAALGPVEAALDAIINGGTP